MDPAFTPCMRDPRLLLPILMMSACGSDPAVVAGDLADGAEATHVWVLGQPERSALSADSFHLDGFEEGTLDLRFASEDEEVARMEIQGVEAGQQLRLRDVWFDDGVAHPSAVELTGEGPVTVNGLRLGGEPIAGPIDAASTVLVVSRSGDALILRPVDEGTPDLKVVVTPGTQVRTPDGDPAAADELEFGDTVRVIGQGEAGYVIATELVLPRSRAGGASRGEGGAAAQLADRKGSPRDGNSAAGYTPAASARASAPKGDRGEADKGKREKGKEKKKRKG